MSRSQYRPGGDVLPEAGHHPRIALKVDVFPPRDVLGTSIKIFSLRGLVVDMKTVMKMVLKTVLWLRPAMVLGRKIVKIAP